MSYTEYRDPRGRLHRVDGPAIISDERVEWFVDGRRHRDEGPAVATKNGTILYYWRGVMVPREVIMETRSKTPGEIIKIENIEVRRAWMECYGMEDFMVHMNPTIRHEDKKTNRVLMELKLPNEEDPMVMVKVINSTPEGKWRDGETCTRCKKTGYVRHEESTPDEEVRRTCPDCNGKGRTKMTFVPELKDGKEWYKTYFIRVPPDQKNANDAIAWTFGLEEKTYKPGIES